MKVAVFGDIGVDRYHIGHPRGLSAEAPIPVLTAVTSIDLPGMGGNVIANLVELGVDVEYVVPGSVGQLTPHPIKHRLYTSDGTQLARWDENDFCPAYTLEDINRLFDIPDLDGVVVTDYNKGSFSHPLLGSTLSDFAASQNLPVFIDTKQSPLRFAPSSAPNLDSPPLIFFPNKSEATAYLDAYRQCRFVVAKLGAEGIGVVAYKEIVAQSPALASHVTCVNGAGDTVLAAFVSGYLRDFDLPTVLQLASCAAANVVEQSFLERTTTFVDTDARRQTIN